jgi:hypothetical protein
MFFLGNNENELVVLDGLERSWLLPGRLLVPAQSYFQDTRHELFVGNTRFVR